MTVIPAMTHELSRHWRQPAADRISIDDKHALMDARTFEELADYSCTTPSGVYDGKMWKRREPYQYGPDTKLTWFLCWYAPSDDPNKCSIKHREILLA